MPADPAAPLAMPLEPPIPADADAPLVAVLGVPPVPLVPAAPLAPALFTETVPTDPPTGALGVPLAPV
jgi:hypothetical protein